MTTDKSLFEVRLAETTSDILAAQKLRYSVFVDELGANVPPDQRILEIETDCYDNYCDHLLLIDKNKSSTLTDGEVVGVYRLMDSQRASDGIGFYSAREYDLSLLQMSGKNCLEIGRSCIAKQYRTSFGLFIMWDALIKYVAEKGIELLFGVASFPGIDPARFAKGLSILHHKFRAPENVRINALPHSFLNMDLIPEEEFSDLEAMNQIPSLIKSYVKLGGGVGNGAFIDYAFNTIDVGLIMDTKLIIDRYKKYTNGTSHI